MQRYVRIKEHIAAIDHVEVRDHFFTTEENKEAKGLLICLSALESVTTELQDEETSLLDARNLSHGLTKKYRRLHSRLHAKTFLI